MHQMFWLPVNVPFEEMTSNDPEGENKIKYKINKNQRMARMTFSHDIA